MEQTVTCLLMAQKFIHSQEKILKLFQIICAWEIKGFSASNMRKTGCNDHIYDFTVDYDAVDVDGILDIHKYLMKKKRHSTIKCLGL